jgi:hypothetical protein
MRTCRPTEYTYMDENDWRLETAGDEAFRGKSFVLRRFSPKPAVTWDLVTGKGTPSEWDHEHCHFCWQKFAAPSLGIEGALEEGYATFFDEPDPSAAAERSSGSPIEPPPFRLQEPVEQGGVWVCPRCFADFRDYYGWTVRADADG